MSDIYPVTPLSHTLQQGVRIGERLADARSLEIRCDDRELAEALAYPWLRRIIEREIRQPLPERELSASSVIAPHNLLTQHSFFCGSTGSGKTVLSHGLLQWQLAQGCSAVILCGKPEDFERVISVCERAQIAPENIHLVDPMSGAQTGWNPLTAEDPTRAVDTMVDVFEAEAGKSWGDRLEDILRNGLYLMAEHQLSLWELRKFLTNTAYRDALLRKPVHSEEAELAQEAFLGEYASASRSASKWDDFIRPVTNKIRVLSTNRFLRSVLCARRDTFHISRLWESEQVALIVNMDEEKMSSVGARLFSGFLVNMLVKKALGTPLREMKRPVVLAVDEIGFIGKFIGKPLQDMGGRGRDRFRLILSCQFMSQLSQELNDMVTSQCQVQAYFRLGPKDAKVAADALADRSKPGVEFIQIEPEEEVWWEENVCDAFGKPFAVSDALWAITQAHAYQYDDPVLSLNEMAKASGLGRLYVAGEAINDTLARLPRRTVVLSGNHPVRVSVCVPSPRFTRIERQTISDVKQAWSGTLQEFPRQRCVLVLGGEIMGVVGVADMSVPPPTDGLIDFIHSLTSQSAKECRTLVARRKQGVVSVSGVTPSMLAPMTPQPVPVMIEDDGSIT